MNIGAPMTGKRRRSRKISGMGINLGLQRLLDIRGLALWPTPADNMA
jgi:hypothetical protein